jgi:transcriptional regulator with XRE-family HTH domain
MGEEQATEEKQAAHSMQEILSTLGRRIRSERQRKGLSQEGFAGVCGLHRTEMGLLERGKTIPRLDTLLLVSQHLGLSVSDLLRGIEP